MPNNPWDELQKDVLPHLRYARGEDVVRTEAQVGVLLQSFIESVERPMTPKQLSERYLIPLFAGLQGLHQLQVADLLRYTQGVLTRIDEDSKAGATIGIPVEDVEAFQLVLDNVLGFFDGLRKANPSNKGKYLDELRTEAAKLMPQLEELHDALGDLALENVEEGEEGFIEFDEDEEAGEEGAEEEPEDDSIIEDDEEEANG